MKEPSRLPAPRTLAGCSSRCVRTALLRKCRKNWPWLAVVVSLQIAQPADAERADRWRPNPAVGLLESVALRIHWLESTDELREAAENSGQKIDENYLKGFSILRRNTQTGAYTCDLYVVKMAGAHVDEDRTTTFGH